MVQASWEPSRYSPPRYQTTSCVICRCGSREFDMICTHFRGVSSRLHELRVWLRPLRLNRHCILHKSHLCTVTMSASRCYSKGHRRTKRANPNLSQYSILPIDDPIYLVIRHSAQDTTTWSREKSRNDLVTSSLLSYYFFWSNARLDGRERDTGKIQAHAPSMCISGQGANLVNKFQST